MSTAVSNGRVRPSKASSGIFTNDEVGYLHRRFTEAAIHLLEDMRKQTMEFAMRTDQDWCQLWANTLPNVAYYNRLVQDAMAADMVALVPDIESAAHVAFRLYVRQNYGRDAYGNINTVEFECPPFFEFFHAFLMYVTAHPFVVRQAVFGSEAVQMADITQAAIQDALRAVLKDRVRIMSTVTREEYARQKAAARHALAAAGTSGTIVHERTATSSSATHHANERTAVATTTATSSSATHYANERAAAAADEDTVSMLRTRDSRPQLEPDAMSASASSRAAWQDSLQRAASMAGSSTGSRVSAVSAALTSGAQTATTASTTSRPRRLMPDDSVSRLTMTTATSAKYETARPCRSIAASPPLVINASNSPSAGCATATGEPPAPPRPTSVRILTFKANRAGSTPKRRRSTSASSLSSAASSK
jgi:hypothetical protein